MVYYTNDATRAVERERQITLLRVGCKYVVALNALRIVIRPNNKAEKGFAHPLDMLNDRPL